MFDNNNDNHNNHLGVGQIVKKPKFQWALFGIREPFICHSLPRENRKYRCPVTLVL